MPQHSARGTEVDARASQALERLQHTLETLYQLEPAPTILSFIRRDRALSRERVLVREDAEGLEVAVMLPEVCFDALANDGAVNCSDAYLEAVEGVSHYLHLADRARTELPTTRLELELQAEVDKFAVLAPRPFELPTATLRLLHGRLYEHVLFLHPAESELGRRYRLANDLAARLWSQLIDEGEHATTRSLLRRFYRAGQAEKIRLVAAA